MPPRRRLFALLRFGRCSAGVPRAAGCRSAVSLRQEELQERVRICGELLQKSAAFVSYQLNVVSGTVADDTYGNPHPVAGPGAGVRRAVAMFDADV